MRETIIRCPTCGTEIPVSEVLSAQIRADLEEALKAEQGERLQRAVAEAEQRARAALGFEIKDLRAQVEERQRQAQAAAERELELKKRARELEERQAALAEEVRARVEAEMKAQAATALEAAVAAAETRAREQSSLELQQLNARLAEQQARLEEAHRNELEIRKRASELEERQRTLDLEVARRLDEEKRRVEESVRKAVGEEQALRLKEKEKQIEDLRRALEEARRRSEQGSQELQGEVLEIDIQAALEQRFHYDRIEPVPKGIRGADLIQEVRNAQLQPCGKIVWELKNTRHWQAGWLDKLKEDQRAVGASLAVLVSVALPEGMHEFGRVEGVWVASLRAWPALAVALREHLIQVAYAHAASEGKGEKMELLYRYLSGDQFRARVQGIVEAFTGMQAQLDRERRAMEKLWREREKQIERVVTNTVGMYGEMRGLIGTSLPEIPALALDAGLLEDGTVDDAPSA
jgi:hypothetical protein